MYSAPILLWPAREQYARTFGAGTLSLSRTLNYYQSLPLEIIQGQKGSHKLHGCHFRCCSVVSWSCIGVGYFDDQLLPVLHRREESFVEVSLG